ncbi:hypothetical protein ABLO16_01895, partial [Mycobacterium tuberculosis]
AYYFVQLEARVFNLNQEGKARCFRIYRGCFRVFRAPLHRTVLAVSRFQGECIRPLCHATADKGNEPVA